MLINKHPAFCEAFLIPPEDGPSYPELYEKFKKNGDESLIYHLPYDETH